MKHRADTQPFKSNAQRKITACPPREVLPRERNREKAPVQRKRPNFQSEPSPRSILLVDDDQSLRRMITVFLKHHNFDVTQAGDGSEAWNQFRLHSYDFVVTDFDMPHVSGIELLRKIRDITSGQPCILASGHIPWDEPDIHSLLHPGAAIEKPFQIHTLLKTIESLTNSSQKYQ